MTDATDSTDDKGGGNDGERGTNERIRAGRHDSKPRHETKAPDGAVYTKKRVQAVLMVSILMGMVVGFGLQYVVDPLISPAVAHFVYCDEAAVTTGMGTCLETEVLRVVDATPEYIRTVTEGAMSADDLLTNLRP